MNCANWLLERTIDSMLQIYNTSCVGVEERLLHLKLQKTNMFASLLHDILVMLGCLGMLCWEKTLFFAGCILILCLLFSLFQLSDNRDYQVPIRATNPIIIIIWSKMAKLGLEESSEVDVFRRRSTLKWKSNTLFEIWAS